jgi:hypothetical protein
MTILVKGGCLCGAVRFSYKEKPLGRRACWCRTCQYMATGNASLSAFFRTETFVLSGPLASHVSTADSGATIRRRFSPDRGTPLFAEDLGQPGVMVVRVGALDDREIGGPESTIWTGSAPSWGRVDPAPPSCAAHPAGSCGTGRPFPG